jgi:hypothetical protein
MLVQPRDADESLIRSMYSFLLDPDTSLTDSVVNAFPFKTSTRRLQTADTSGHWYGYRGRNNEVVLCCLEL